MNDLIKQLAYDSWNPELNFSLAREYHKLGQTASASIHYLRCAENTKNTDLVYESLLQLFNCFSAQNNRNFTATYLLKQAIALLPQRPEGYFFLCRYYEQNKEYYEAYIFSCIALSICNFNLPKLPSITDFLGKFTIMFIKAQTAWYWEKTEETRRIFVQLIDEYRDVMHECAPEYLQTVQNNLMNIGVGPVSVAFNEYKQENLNNFKFPFNDLNEIKKNYSQLYQDMFVLSILKGKKEGTYLEIGSGDPFHGNNTALLEVLYNWSGVSIDRDEKLVKKFNEQRKNLVMCKDALAIDYKQLLKTHYNTNIIDYLQIDCEPSKHTFEILLSIPFDEYKFAVITFEHDHTVDVTRSYRLKSRNYLKSLGYQMIVNDIGPTDWYTTEDWWVHPELVDPTILQNMTLIEDKIHKAEDYMLHK
jgi:hypothetical protein